VFCTVDSDEPVLDVLPAIARFDHGNEALVVRRPRFELAFFDEASGLLGCDATALPDLITTHEQNCVTVWGHACGRKRKCELAIALGAQITQPRPCAAVRVNGDERVLKSLGILLRAYRGTHNKVPSKFRFRFIVE
jgi:hypothetical protein